MSNIADGTALFVDQERVIIEAADGFRWSGELQGAPLEDRIVPGGSTYDGSDRTRAFLEIPYAIYNHFSNVPVTMRITLAVSRLQMADSATVPIPPREIDVPGFGICTVEAAGYGTMQCRSALREPGITYISASGWSDTSCSSSESEIRLTPAYPWIGLPDREPAAFGIVPIQFVRASYSWPFGIAAVKKHLCTGTPITFTQYKFRDRVQVKFTIPDLYFPPVNPASNVDYSDGHAH